MAKLPLGQLVGTHSVAEIAQTDQNFASFVVDCVFRHSIGEWGDLCFEDKQMNDTALTSGGRILSAYDYPLNPDWKIWIITEWDRSITTILFPDEY